MKEDQRTEWKSSWRDEYLKCLKRLCGFANAQNGVLQIGRDDRGRVVGIENAKRLLEELPNKLRDLLAIVAEIELLEEDGKPYLRIAVEPNPVPISYRGEYLSTTSIDKTLASLKDIEAPGSKRPASGRRVGISRNRAKATGRAPRSNRSG
jgi:predicted HTH transcriptional regulator